jgi:hypothetical protein
VMKILKRVDTKLLKGLLDKIEERYLIGTATYRVTHTSMAMIEIAAREGVKNRALDLEVRYASEALLNDVLGRVKTLEEDDCTGYESKVVFSLTMIVATLVMGLAYVYSIH